MRRLLTGEKTGLGLELKDISTVICWLLLINTALPQIPINGFCQLNSFPTLPGYNKFAVIDVNYDSFNDYILYSSSDNSLQVVERMKDTTFSSYRIFSIYNISVLIPVFDNKPGYPQFFFIDRTKRTAGLFDLKDKNRVNVISKIGFNSFPENIAVSDVNNDGVMDCLVSGSGFDGLSILNIEDNKLVETKIKSNASYAEAVFGDISNDGFPDIVAFNLFSNALDIFFNDELGNFELIRSIRLNQNIENLRVVRNSDEYDDIVFSSNGIIKIIPGDFESSYDNLVSISIVNKPDRFVFADFNNDRLKDIAYINTKTGSLSIIFAKSEKQYYPEIVYLKSNGLTDLKVIRKNYNNGLAILNSKGEVFRITKLSSLPEETKIVPAVEPAAIISFDYGNDGVEDICYLDKSNNTLNFLLSNYSGIPTYFCSAPVSAEHDEIIVDETEPFNKGFYCYSSNKKMFEIVDYNFTADKSDSDQLYAPGAVKDLAIKRTDDLVHIYVAFVKNKILKIGEYEHHYFRFNYREYSYADTGVVKAKLIITDSPELYYWKEHADSLYFIRAKTNSRFTDFRIIGGMKNRIMNPSTVVHEYLTGEENPAFLTLFETDSSLYSSFSVDSIFIFSNQFMNSSISNDTAGIISSQRYSMKKDESVIVYLPKLKSFNKIGIGIGNDKLDVEKLFEKENVKDYVVRKKKDNNNYLIYTVQSEGYLSLKRLK